MSHPTPAELAAAQQAATGEVDAPVTEKKTKAAKAPKAEKAEKVGKTAEEKQAEKDAKKAEAEAKKAEAKAAKEAEALDQATAVFDESHAKIVTLTSASATIFNELGATPSSEDLKTAATESAVLTKEAKAELRKLNGALRKANTPELQERLSSAEALILEQESNAKKAKEFVADVKKKEAEAAKEAKAAEREAAKMPIQNDVRRPKTETACGQVWTLIDTISEQLGQPAPISYVMEYGQQKGFDPNTLKTQYARWKKFQGLEGRVATPVQKIDV